MKEENSWASCRQLGRSLSRQNQLGFVANTLKGVSWSVGVVLIVLNYSGVSILGSSLSLLVLSLIAAPAVVSILREEKPRASLLWVVLLSISLRLIPPLSDGNTTFMISSDSVYQFQVADIYQQHGAWIWGLQTGRAIEYIFYPALQLVSVEISTVANLSLYQVCRFLPIVFSVVIVMIAFATYTLMVGGRAAIVACFLFSICYKYNWFDGFYIQESLGIVFFVMAFYAVFRGTVRRDRSIALVFFSASLLLMMTHFFSSLMLWVALGLCWLQLRVVKRIPRSSLRTGVLQFGSVFAAFAGWTSFVAVVMVGTGLSYGFDYSVALAGLFTHPVEPALPESTGIHLTMGEVLIVYVGFLIAGVIGFVGMVRAMRAIHGRSSYEENASFGRIAISCVVALAFGTLALAGIFLSGNTNPDVPYRFIPFVFFFWSPVFAAGMLYVKEHIQSVAPTNIPTLKRRIVLASLCLVLILPAASTWLLMPAYINHSQTRLDDVKVTAISTWLASDGDKNTVLVGDSIMTTPTAALARQQFTQLDTAVDPLPGILYYGDNIAPLTRYVANHTTYVLVNNAYVSHKYYLITYYYENKPPPSEDLMASSVNRLNALPVLNVVYCSSSISLYASPSR
jgi:hypothetical protein